MSKDYKKYVQFLASGYNILYVGRENEAIYDKTADYFLSASKIDMTQEMLDKIDLTLSKRHISIAVIDASVNDSLAEAFVKNIEAFDEDILTILLYNPKEYRKVFDIVSCVDALIPHPLDESLFHKKLFTVMSRSYAINSIGRRDIVLKQKNVTEDAIDVFFDTYEGSALFLADDLMEMVQLLNAGNITQNFLNEIAKALDEVATIFAKSEQTKTVTPIYEQLASFVRDLDLEAVAPQNLEAFSYLSEILSDVSIYLMDMFVDRIFKDVYVFEHSLQNNIKFMEDRLTGVVEDEDESELDFF